ncbi:hypothetical protein [Histophilus somni]|uniref:hypothetical protein n=1 Tax=Histophilus somni TaxID=731 RepID=UPI00201F2E60|nr:hypothetical protein [Histophilus somni]
MKHIDKIIKKEYEIYKERYRNYLDNTNPFTQHMAMESSRVLKILCAIQEDIDLYDEELNDFTFEMKFAKFLANLDFNFRNK